MPFDIVWKWFLINKRSRAGTLLCFDSLCYFWNFRLLIEFLARTSAISLSINNEHRRQNVEKKTKFFFALFVLCVVGSRIATNWIFFSLSGILVFVLHGFLFRFIKYLPLYLLPTAKRYLSLVLCAIGKRAMQICTATTIHEFN